MLACVTRGHTPAASSRLRAVSSASSKNSSRLSRMRTRPPQMVVVTMEGGKLGIYSINGISLG